MIDLNVLIVENILNGVIILLMDMEVLVMLGMSVVMYFVVVSADHIIRGLI